MKRPQRYLLLLLCLVLFEGCAGKKCKRCKGGGGGGGGNPPAGQGGAGGTHGPDGGGANNLDPAPAGGNEKGTGPSNQNPFGSQFVPFDDNGGAGNSVAPGVGGGGSNGTPPAGVPSEADPRNFPSFQPAPTNQAPGFGGNAGTGNISGSSFAPTSPVPGQGGLGTPTGNANAHPAGPSANERGPLPTFTASPPTPLVPPTSSLHSALGKCVACHKTKGSELSETLKDVNGLAGQFPSMPAKHLADMIGRTADLTAPELEALRKHVADTRAARANLVTPKTGTARSACFMSETQRQQLIGSMPPVTGNSALSQFLNQSRQSGNIQFYDRQNVPLTWSEAYMDDLRQPARLLSPAHATRPDNMERYGYHSDGAREFPWQTTAGLDISPSGGATKFFIPPPQGPMFTEVTKTRQSHPNDFGTSSNINGPQMGWVYSAGTTFGETLRVRDPQSGQMIPFEIRLRTKQPNGTWAMDVMRPFANSAELAAAVKKLCAGGGAPPECAQIKPAVAQLEQPKSRNASLASYVNQQTMRTKRDPLLMSRTALEAAQPNATLETLPDLPPSLVRRLLMGTPFKSVFGQPWNAGPPPGWAPTSTSDFNIVPKNYFGGFIPMNQNGCMKCHDSAGRHVDNFDPGPGQMFSPASDDSQSRPRTWYNFIPGDDGILSFHPFSASAVGHKGGADRSSVDPCWIQSGLFR